MSLSNLWVSVLVPVSGRFAGVHSEVLVLTIGSGVLGGSHSRCACVASWPRTLGWPFSVLPMGWLDLV